MSEQKHLVDVRGLKEYFPVKSGMLNKMMLKAVDDVSFTIDEGETLGLVGESGCGKTTVGRTLLHLYKPTAGEEYFDGKLISYEVEKIKPDHEIYRILCERYALKPEESVFIDDRKINVDAAKALGFEGVVFTGYPEAKAAVEEMIWN